MISLETIGFFTDEPDSQRYPQPFAMLYPSSGDFLAFIGNRASGAFVRDAIGEFRRRARFPSEGLAAPGFVFASGLSDHWSFWQCDYPALMVTDTAMFRYSHYHRASDTADQISWDAFAQVVDALVPMVDALAN